MIAPQIAVGKDPGPDAIRANQLLEAGLWLHLGGDTEGARSLFGRALSHDPSNRRAREWLAKSEAARAAAPGPGVPSPAVRPMPSAPVWVSQPSPVASQPALEVSVVLLDEGEAAPLGAAEEDARLITADVLDFLVEPLSEPEAPRPVVPASVPVRVLTPPPGLVARVEPVQEVAMLLQGVQELLSLGDVASAMELLRRAEQLAPGDARVAAARECCARQQQAALEAKLGDLKRVPALKLRMAELMKLSLEPRAGFLLSRIDGRLSYEALFAVSGMSRLDTMRLLALLLDQDIITVR